QLAAALQRLAPTAEKGQGDDPSRADVGHHETDAAAGAPSEPPLMAPVTVTTANGRTLDGQAGVHVTRQRQTTSTNKEQLIGRPRPSTPQNTRVAMSHSRTNATARHGTGRQSLTPAERASEQ